MSTRATVTRSVKRARVKANVRYSLPRLRKAAHKLARRLWRAWVRSGADGREPTPRPLTSWELY